MKLHFVRSIRGLQNFLTISIMNTLAGFMIVLAIACCQLDMLAWNLLVFFP